jgi:trk system potassium uptake protein TrkA
MDIVIVGAGTIGSYVASFMSKKDVNVTVIDTDERKLDLLSRENDVATRLGSGTDWRLLDELTEFSPSLILALTQNDETNLVVSSIAKNLGYSQAIARVRQEHFFNQVRLDFPRLFFVDQFIGPEFLAAQDILKLISLPGSIEVQSFSHGAIYMRTLRVPLSWKHGHKKLHELNLPKGLVLSLIYRLSAQGKEEIIFPHGGDVILPGDEVTFIGEAAKVEELHTVFRLPVKKVESVVIIGGSLVAYHLACLLIEKGVSVRILHHDYTACIRLARQLPEATIINHLETDLTFYESERFDKADYFIACTESDERNLLASALAKKAGCRQIVALLDGVLYSSLVKDLQIKTVSPRMSAANRILTLVQAEKVSSMVSLYENQAEILEFRVSLDSQIAGIPLATLGPLLPREFLIAVIQNRGRILVANGDRILCPGDTVIAISSPEHVRELRKLF